MATWRNHTFFKRQDTGTLMAVGQNVDGRLSVDQGFGTTTGIDTPEEVTHSVLSDVVQIEAGGAHTVYLTKDGRVYTDGGNGEGQLGVIHGYINNPQKRGPHFIMDDVVQVAAGQFVTMALKSNGDLYGWGANSEGEVGNISFGSGYEPHKTLELVKEVSCGFDASYAITSNGELYACGNNNEGQTGLRFPTNYVSRWTKVIDNVQHVSGGYRGFVVMINNRMGGIRDQTFNPLINEVKSVMSGVKTSYAKMMNNEIRGFGDNSHGQLGNANYNPQSNVLVSSNVRLFGGGYQNFIITSATDGGVYGCGRSDVGQLSIKNVQNPLFINIAKTAGRRATMIVNNSMKDMVINARIEEVVGGYKVSANITHDVDSPMKYRIMVNDRSVYPEYGWTVPTNGRLEVDYTIPASDIVLGENKIVLVIRDEFGTTEIYPKKFLVTNEAPKITSYKYSKNPVHTEDSSITATITDDDGDRVKYRILFNGNQIFPEFGFSPLLPSGTVITHELPHRLMIIGENKLEVVMEDERGLAGYFKSTELLNQNDLPTIEAEIRGTLLKCKIADLDGDRIRFRITLNDKQIIPSDGWSKLVDTPIVLDQSIDPRLIVMGSKNKLVIEAIDPLGGHNVKNIYFEGEPSGLMFCDANEKFYTTNLGELLKYLDFGAIIAGQTTPAERVWMKNTLGYPIQNTRIKINQGDLDGVSSKIEISRYDSPFTSEEELTYTDLMDHGDKVGFYVRIVTENKSTSQGVFNITVKADPVIE